MHASILRSASRSTHDFVTWITLSIKKKCYSDTETHRSRHCFPFLPGNERATAAHRLFPSIATNSIMRSSSCRYSHCNQYPILPLYGFICVSSLICMQVETTSAWLRILTSLVQYPFTRPGWITFVQRWRHWTSDRFGKAVAAYTNSFTHLVRLSNRPWRSSLRHLHKKQIEHKYTSSTHQFASSFAHHAGRLPRLKFHPATMKQKIWLGLKYFVQNKTSNGHFGMPVSIKVCPIRASYIEMSLQKTQSR